MGKKKKTLLNEEAFINAANYRLLEKIDELIDKVDINCQDQYGNTALHYISQNSDYLLAIFFLERNVDVNVLNNERETPLFAAVSTIIHEGMLFSEEARLVFTLLVSHGANIEELSSLRENNLDRFQLSTLDEIIETLNNVTFTAEEALDYVMEYINGPEETLEDTANDHLEDNYNLENESPTPIAMTYQLPNDTHTQQPGFLIDEQLLSLHLLSLVGLTGACAIDH